MTTAMLNTDLNTPIDFSFQFSIKDTSVFLAHHHRLIRIVWDGRINLHTARLVLGYASDVVEGGLVDKVLLDRRKLIHFDSPTRKWIKEELIRGRAKSLRKHLHKIAVINENSVAGSIFSKRITDVSDRNIISLPIRKFDQARDAENWVLKY